MMLSVLLLPLTDGFEGPGLTRTEEAVSFPSYRILCHSR